MSNNKIKTEFFTNCWGVFEGGGVRGSAHAGAFSAASECGVAFGRVAGTSAGSIIAALIAAGATPEYLKEQLDSMPMKDFLANIDKNKSIFNPPNIFVRWLGKLLMGTWRNFFNIYHYGGIFSSNFVEDWIDQRLQELLHDKRPLNKKSKVRFKELRIPLHIVATDLTEGGIKVWSSETTPDEYVADAVRCSCSIPFFFQPVQFNSSLYVDGGALGNLPSFVFSDIKEKEKTRSALSRILCFRLKENTSEVKQPANKIVDFAKDLAEAIVTGATDIQQSLQDGIYTIDIDTGDVKSTDFHSIDKDKKEMLFEAGRFGVIEFIKNERINLKQVFSHFVLKGYDEMLFSVIQGLRSSNDFFCAVGISTFWITLIFPIVLNAARRGIAINIITTVTEDAEELKRRKLLEGLGAKILIVDKEENLPFTGFIFDPHLESGIAVLCSKSGHVGVDYSYNDGDSRIYYREKDSSLISLLFILLKKYELILKQDKLNIPYTVCNEEEIFNKLRSVSQYKSCRFELKQIDVSDNILVLQRNVKEFKILQILTHVHDLESSNCELFYPKKVKLINGKESYVVPPIFEASGDKLILIDGNSRLFYCLKNNVNKIYAIIVHGVEGSLPSTPVSIKELGLISSTISLNDNMESFIKSNFRKIEDAVRS